jgi:predicted flap endonuclease-1-like 5' DNA nuclease
MLLFNIVYAAHARGTHHKLALDALHHMADPQADKWQRVFLKYADVYMDGAKDPDDEFKDFKNHVLHVRDGYWGGAAQKATAWYQHLVEGLVAKDWERAVYAAGVLSHYYTDPICPLHTAQSEAENVVHAAVEWSINRSYDDLRALAVANHGDLAIDVPKGANWLADLVCQGAETSTVYYEKLISHYDFKAGVVDPPSGLDQTSRAFIAELLMYAAKGFAVILDRAILDSKVEAPDVSLTLETVMAAVKIPAKALAKRLANAADRRQVEAMYDELMATGRVEATLPADDRMVRDLYAKEVLAPREKTQAAARAARLVAPTSPELIARAEAVSGKKSKKPAAQPAALASGGTVAKPVPRSAVPGAATPTPPPAVRQLESASLQERLASVAPTSVPAVAVPSLVRPSNISSAVIAPAAAPTPAPLAVVSKSPSVSVPLVEAPARVAPTVPSQPAAPSIREIQPIKESAALRDVIERAMAASDDEADSATTDSENEIADVQNTEEAPLAPVRDLAAERAERVRALRYNLSEADDLERAPSIGPSLAEKFADLGVISVGDFLDQEPRDLAEVLDDTRYGTNIIMSWQDQARLVIQVPGLSGTGAQLLVGAGFRSLRALQLVDPATLCSAILQFSTTPQGQRVLRDGAPPDVEKIKLWSEAARMQKAA